jgi:hypothetical protein
LSCPLRERSVWMKIAWIGLGRNIVDISCQFSRRGSRRPVAGENFAKRASGETLSITSP